MADIPGRHGPTLTDDDYTTIAGDVGTTQGAYVADGELPDAEWLSRSWLRGWVGACERLVDDLRDDPLTDDVLAALRPYRERVLALWDAREELLAIVESAPQTLVHCDFWPANLFVDDDGQAVAIDWSQIGIGGLAQDLDQITLDTVWMQVRPDCSLDLLERLIVPAYAEGVRSAGADVTDAQVRWWYAAAAAVHYAWMAGAIAQRSRDEADVAGQEQRFDRSFADLVADRARVIERALDLGERALGSQI
jgi:thiamine kinase-like enzyme